jgi:hypothetical protein
LAEYLQRKSERENIAGKSIASRRQLEATAAPDNGNTGNGGGGDESDDSQLNDEEEQLLDRLMATHQSIPGASMRLDLSQVSCTRVYKAP